MCLTLIRKLFCRNKIKDNVEDLQVTEPINDSNASFNKKTVEMGYAIVDEKGSRVAMRLPPSFGSKRHEKRSVSKTQIGKDHFTTFVIPSLKEYYENQSLDTARPKVSNMGYFYENRTCKVAIQKRKDTDLQSDIDTLDDSDNEMPQVTNFAIKSTSIEEKESESLLKDVSSVADMVKNFISANINDYIHKENESLHGKNNEEQHYSDCTFSKSELEEEMIQDDAMILGKTNNRENSVPNEILQDKSLMRYYRRRYTLFSLYDCGIKLDREAWYSATPECIARHTADRLRCNVIVDGFCGTGGNSIQFAKTCKKVIAIDIDPNKVEMARHNARIYGVADKIEFIVGNYVQLAPTMKADAVFLSPPWGGPDYKSKTTYDLEKHLQPLPASSLFILSQNISGNIALFLPKNSNTEQIVILAGKGNRVELEENFLFGRLIAKTAYYGNLIRTSE